MYGIAGKSGLQAATLRVDDDAAGRVSGGILKPDAILNFPVHTVVALHDVGQSCIHNR